MSKGQRSKSLGNSM